MEIYPEYETNSYQEQLRYLFNDKILYSDSFSRSMQAIGHDATELVWDFEILQKNWAKERFFTLEQLKRENPGIEKVYSDAFEEAEARGIFYNARYLMAQKRFNEARSKLKTISKKSKKYFILYICSFIPTFWNLICSPIVKRKLTQKLL